MYLINKIKNEERNLKRNPLHHQLTDAKRKDRRNPVIATPDFGQV
jgi:hypothetical protein